MASSMGVVDTSAWIEWLVGSALGKKLSKEFPSRSRCIVPTIVQLELSKWLLREAGEELADQVIAYTQKCRVVPLDTAIALLAAELHREYKLATADAVVYATARQHGSTARMCLRVMRTSMVCPMLCSSESLTVHDLAANPQTGRTLLATA